MGANFAANPGDEALATQTITAQDVGTSTFTGANSQQFYAGTPTTNSAASFTVDSFDTVNIQATLLGGGGTLVVEVSQDGGTFWLRPNTYQISTGLYTNSFTAPFSATVALQGLTNVRVRAISSWTGTATILALVSPSPRGVIVTEALPGGANNLGSITNITGTVSLPTGAATSALQTTGNNSLASIDAGIPTALGQTTMSASMPVAIASDQTGVPVKISDATGNNVTLGQKAMASSLPVVIASDQSAVPVSQSGTWNINNVSGTVSLPTGASTAALQTTGNTSLSSIDAGIPAALGQTTSANSMPVVLPSDQVVAIAVSSSTKTSYSAAATFTAAALPTDVFTITGSGTKTVKITKILITLISTVGGSFIVNYIKRSAANTGGTSTTLTNVPHDSTNAAGTATVRSYTVNPTALGAAVGTIRSYRLFASGAVTVASPIQEDDFGQGLAQPIVLRGTAEVLAINFNATTITGNGVSISVEYLEE